VGRMFYVLNQKYAAFMQGRYGTDELNIFLIIASLVMLLLSRIVFLRFLYFVALIFMLFCVIRTYSRNISKRYEEKEKFIRYKNRFMTWYSVKRDAWNHRKTHCYFRCKNCKASIRVPKGVGKVEVTCPRCKSRFIKKT